MGKSTGSEWQCLQVQVRYLIWQTCACPGTHGSVMGTSWVIYLWSASQHSLSTIHMDHNRRLPFSSCLHSYLTNYLPGMVAKLSDTGSTKSSTISSKATLLKKAAGKAVKTVTQPFKKLKQSLSSHSATWSIASHSSCLFTVLPLSNNEDDDPNAIDKEPEVKLTPEQELGSSCYFISNMIIMNIFSRCTETNLASTYLFILQTRPYLAELWGSTMPCFYLCCSEVQDSCTHYPSLSGLEGQGIHSKPEAPCPPLLWWRCSQGSYHWKASTQTQPLHLCALPTEQKTTGEVLSSCTYQPEVW